MGPRHWFADDGRPAILLSMDDVIRDTFGRPLRNLRVSVTDRCNLRCQYCMPEEDYVWLPKPSLLTFEEIARVIRIFSQVGVDKIRLTGGEPLLRQGIVKLVRMIGEIPAITDLAMTTNGVTLSGFAADLRTAGLKRMTVSLDTLQESRFREFTRRSKLADVVGALKELQRLGFTGTKINTVVTRGFNDDELLDLLDFAGSVGAELRFIEYMDVGGATQWSMDKVVPRTEILTTIAAHHGAIEPVVRKDGSTAPAERYHLDDGTRFGIIASTTEPFCRTCDRARLTADGMLFTCLYADQGFDLREPIRDGVSDDGLVQLIADHWRQRTDRGAEQRKNTSDRGALYQISSLRSDPHREMHTRGG